MQTGKGRKGENWGHAPHGFFLFIFLCSFVVTLRFFITLYVKNSFLKDQSTFSQLNIKSYVQSTTGPSSLYTIIYYCGQAKAHLCNNHAV